MPVPGGDSSGVTPLSPWGGLCPYVDPTRDLLHIKLSYNSFIDNYTMNAYRVVEGFYLPVDAILVGNILYVIENSSTGDIWKITMPNYSNIKNYNSITELKIYPNPSAGTAEFNFYTQTALQLEFSLFTIEGQEVIKTTPYSFGPGNNKIVIDLSSYADGVYVYKIKTNDNTSVGKLIKN